DQITDRPFVTPRVMLVPTGKVAEPVDPTGTRSRAGVEETVSPARPLAVRVSAAVAGAGAPTPQTLATPPPPQVCGPVQTPHVSVPPQPSGIVPQFFPCAAQVVGVQMTQPRMGVCTQPVAGAQVSVVHGSPSLQLSAGPPTQVPAVHTSGAVQALPSLQSARFGVPRHTPAPLHASV